MSDKKSVDEHDGGNYFDAILIAAPEILSKSREVV